MKLPRLCGFFVFRFFLPAVVASAVLPAPSSVVDSSPAERAGEGVS
ncbi:hypothetical protein AADG42_12550 [Ammonicoccus fulvus]|uniref:Uncharacterized protein n=1 Tax=Ammonicoccus fulvus TaxID=3138240 RepID=A0ABZ3FPW6_9ACTN